MVAPPTKPQRPRPFREAKGTRSAANAGDARRRRPTGFPPLAGEISARTKGARTIQATRARDYLHPHVIPVHPYVIPAQAGIQRGGGQRETKHPAQLRRSRAGGNPEGRRAARNETPNPTSSFPRRRESRESGGQREAKCPAYSLNSPLVNRFGLLDTNPKLHPKSSYHS